jgi:hypothetical protein
MVENLEKLVNSEIEELKREEISPEVAVSSVLKDYDNNKIVLSFEPYNQGCCEIALIQKQDAKRLTSELRKMTKTLRKHFLCQSSSGIACKPIKESGNYACLFTGLEQDIELLEVDYTGTGRIFGYLTRNIFNVVAIKIKHIK